jgi:hypothetical protein
MGSFDASVNQRKVSWKRAKRERRCAEGTSILLVCYLLGHWYLTKRVRYRILISLCRCIQPQSLQDYLDTLLKSHGYSTRQYRALDSAYYNTPTALQLASYDVHMRSVILRDEGALYKALVCGLSPNACNQFGDSLVHKVCRLLGDYDLFQVVFQAGCSLQCADDYGRTPMHDACWSADPSFGVFETLMQEDIHMFYMQDNRGFLPLSYISAEHKKDYINFLDAVKDVYWPVRSVARDGEEQPPPLALEKPNSRPIPDPRNALS